jgi:tRNA 2-thiouridine synthesizing protein E
MDADAHGVENLDGDSFLKKGSGWSRDVARKLSKLNELGPLTDDHWKIIEFVREYYTEHHDGPPIVKISKATGLSSTYICKLFPCGIAKGAYRLAGLPRPSGCL